MLCAGFNIIILTVLFGVNSTHLSNTTQNCYTVVLYFFFCVCICNLIKKIIFMLYIFIIFLSVNFLHDMCFCLLLFICYIDIVPF